MNFKHVEPSECTSSAALFRLADLGDGPKVPGSEVGGTRVGRSYGNMPTSHLCHQTQYKLQCLGFLECRFP